MPFIRTLMLSVLTLFTVISFAAEADAPVLTGQKDLAALQKLVAGKKNLTWVFTGDSITHGAMHTKGWRSYPEIAFERIRWELKRMRDVVVNTGISGDKVAGILKEYDERIGRFKPDIVSVKIGMNDCGAVKAEEFKRDLFKLVKKIKKDKAIVILQTTNTVKKGDKRAEKLAPFMEITREVAKTENVILVDNYAKWEKDSDNSWYNDNIHPNGKGHLEIAKTLFQTLGLDKDSACLALKI